MKKHIFYIIALNCLFSLTSIAQNDSTFSDVRLQEIVIQNENSIVNGRERKQNKDLQTSTESLLENTKGVQLIRRGNFAQEPMLRSLSGGQISNTIDGMAIFGACTDKMDPISSYIEPSNLQSIVVSYGMNDLSNETSIGGGFNYKLKQPRINATKMWSGMAGLGYETNANAVQVLAGLNFSGKKFGFNVNGIFRNAGNYRAGGGEKISFSQYQKWNGSVAMKYQISPHESVSLNYIQDEGYNIGYPALTMDVAFAKAKIGSISYRKHFDGILQSWENKVYFNFIDHAMDDTHRPKSQVPMHMDMPGQSTTIGFYSEVKLVQNKHEISAKLNGYQNRLHAEMTMYPDVGNKMYMLTIPDAQRNLLGLNVSDQWEINQKWQLNFGGRIDMVGSSIFSEEGKKLLSGLGNDRLNRTDILYSIFSNMRWKWNEKFAMNTNITRTMRSATLQELYGFYLFNRNDNFDYLGNPNLKKETSWNFSAGLQLNHKNIDVELNGFVYFMSDYIVGMKRPNYSVMTIGASGVKQYANIPSARLMGMDLSLNWKLNDQFQFLSTNTYTQGQDFSGQALPLIAPFKSVNRFSFSWKQFQISLSNLFSAAQNNVSNNFYGETKTPAYHLINLSIGKTFPIKNQKVSLNIGVENIFDTKYTDHLDVMKIPRPGRNMIFHITYSF